MPTGPQGQKRSADAIGCAVQVAQIATGQAKDPPPSKPSTLRRFYDKAAPYFKVKPLSK